MKSFLVASSIVLLFVSSAAKLAPQALNSTPEASELPNPTLTPGAWRTHSAADYTPGATRAERGESRRLNVRKTIFLSYGVPWQSRQAYELDHLVPLCLGGADVIANLWPEPREGVWGAPVKDRLERCVCRLACGMQAFDAERAAWQIAKDWRVAYGEYVPLCAPEVRLRRGIVP